MPRCLRLVLPLVLGWQTLSLQVPVSISPPSTFSKVSPSPISVSPSPFSVTPALVARRSFLVRSPAALLVLLPLLGPSAALAASPKLADTVSSTSARLTSIVSRGEKSFVDSVVGRTADDAPLLPPQIPRTSFQKLAPRAQTIQASDFGMMEAEDFLFVAADYAESAGAARDLLRLADLAGVGEGGGDELKRNYAKRSWEEVEKASVLLGVLSKSVEAGAI